MRIVDANVLLYAVNTQSHHHEPARAWLEKALSAHEPVGFAWVVLLAFLRITTNPRIFASPLTPDSATATVEGFLAAPSALIVEPTSRHLSILRGLISQVGTAGNLTTDAHLAALAIDFGATVLSFDADFNRFPGVSVEVPR